MSSRVSELIRYFVERVPNAGRTRIVKFLYMADLEARRYLGRPLTDLDYHFDRHGPFDPFILQETNRLTREGFIEEEANSAPEGYMYYRYRATRKQLACPLKREESAIVDYVVKNFADMKLDDLLYDVVYETPPMQVARDRGQRLDMDLVNNQARIPGLELEDVLESVEELQAGGGIYWEDVLAETTE